MNKNIKIFVTLLIAVAAMGAVYFLGVQKNNLGPSAPLSVPVATPAANQPPADNPVNWKTYSNNDYSFRLDYPGRFEITENTKRENNYDTLATLVSQSKSVESLTLRVIHDVGIYKNEKPENVAKREIMNSGLKYSITTTKVGDYFAAITTYDVIYPTIRTIVVTIAHPSKNLFMVIDINADLSRVDFEQLLSSFRFIDSDQGVLDLVKNLPDVKNWLAIFTGPGGTGPNTGGKPMFRIEGQTGGVYTVRAYEDVPAPEAHTATFNVYQVNVKTGKISKEF